MNAKWKPDEIKEKLATDVRWLERGILAIYQFQTHDEKARERTEFFNQVGFSGVHAPFGTSLAKQLLEGRHLTDKQLTAARKMMKHYAVQLAKIANGKQEA